MNTAILIIATLGVLAFPNGEERIDAPTHIVAVQSNSAQANGTLKLQSVVEYVTETNVTQYVTNVVERGTWTELRDAYVGTDLKYYGGSSATAWSNAWVSVGSATNRVSTLRDGNSVKGVWTNVATRIKQRYEPTTTTVTNVTVKTHMEYVRHPMTNTVLSVTLANGRYSSVTNLYLPGGKVIGSGTALEKGASFLFIEK